LKISPWSTGMMMATRSLGSVRRIRYSMDMAVLSLSL
jgi:hypothetical protein